MIVRSIQSVLSLVLLMGAGWWLAGKSWFGQRGGDIFSKLSVQVFIPAYMCYNVLTTCGSREELLELLRGVPIPMAVMFISCAAALLLIKTARVRPGRRGVFLNAVTFCNTVLVGFPIITTLFGDEAASIGMVYYMSNTVLFWTVGVYALRVDSGTAQKFLSLANIKKIFSAPLVGFLIGVLLVLFGVELPFFLLDPLKRLGQCTTPVAMMFIGCLLHDTDFKAIWSSREIWVVIVVRFLFAPALMLGVCSLLPVSLLMKQVFFIMSTMPAMTQLGIMAKESGSDAHFASAAVAATTVICMGTLPIYTTLLALAG